MRKRQLSELLTEVQDAIADDQPYLSAITKTDGILVFGKYLLKPTGNAAVKHGPIAHYEIEIRFPITFPLSEPVVRETGGIIPHDPDHHINPEGDCCIVVWEVWALSNKRVTVKSYFNEAFRNFFLGQFLKKNTGEWPFGEELHGKKGIIDAFSKLLSCEPCQRRIRGLLQVLSKEKSRGKWVCPCGSGRVVKDCCVVHIVGLKRKVSTMDATRMLVRLKPCDR